MFITTGRDSLGLGRRLEASLPLPCLLHLAMHTIDAHCQCKLGKFVFSLHIHISPLKLRPYGAIYKNVYHHYYSCININILILIYYYYYVMLLLLHLTTITLGMWNVHYVKYIICSGLSQSLFHWLSNTWSLYLLLRPKSQTLV